MKRDANLVPLSRQHFRALVLCMRIHRKRARPSLLQREMLVLYAEDVRFHFQAEEKFLFPAARRLALAEPLVRELQDEHKRLRHVFAAARRRALKSEELTRFADLLEGHIRKEERRLFEECQKRMSAEEMSSLGTRMLAYLRRAEAERGSSCKLRGSVPRG
ncbi:MAG: hemerythrin domain-containing protein [Terriglobales bacterium]